MTLRIRGPLANQFVELLERHCGLELDRNANTDEITINGDGLINPFTAPSLRTLVRQMISQQATVTVTARSDISGGVIDSFFSVTRAQLPRRSVFLNDLNALEQLDPQLCAAMIAHFLAEYNNSAVRGAPRQLADAHVAGLWAEAQVIHELTGRPIFQGASRPWDRATQLPTGQVQARRFYGPGNIYLIFLGPGPVFPILNVSRTDI